MAKKLTFDDVAEIALGFPGVEEGTSYGTRAWKAGKKFMMRAKEQMDDVLVIGVDSLDEQEMLLERAGDVYFITDHYKGWPTVLVRVNKIGKRELTALIERSWRRAATGKMLAAYEG